MEEYDINLDVELAEQAYNMRYLYGAHELNFLLNIIDPWYGPLSKRQEHWLGKIKRRIVLKIVVPTKITGER